MRLLMLIDNISGYLHFMDVQQLPSEITRDRMVETHLRSTGVPVVHHRMKASLKTLPRLLNVFKQSPDRDDGSCLSEALSCAFH
jgi:hypothetical protein